MLWSTPDRDVQAAPFHSAFTDPSPDPIPDQVLTHDDSLRRGLLNNNGFPAPTRNPFFDTPAVDSARIKALAADSARAKARVDSLKKLSARDSIRLDTVKTYLTKADSARIDSMRRIPRDSTARLAQFFYKRPESITALPVQPRGYAMFLKQPALVQTEVRLDSTGRFVIVRETVGGKDVKIPVRMPVAEYVNLRFKQGITKNYEELVLKNQDVKKRDDLGELLTSFTNIDIPIPANPVFSIFGPPRINLHISGAVDIRAAFRNTTTDQITTSSLGNSRNEPDFAQEVQINVSGTIGDKLNIVADWNTQRQFEYENQLKIKYTGYEDEVVQSVEAGNVSLATNSKFISSSSALFGIKAQFQLGPLKLTAIASQKKGQVQEKTITGGSSEVPFDKKAYDYSKDHFFIDTVYRQYYEGYLNPVSPTINHDTQIKDYEVWITNTSLDLTNAKKGIAYINLDKNLTGDPAFYKSDPGKERDPLVPSASGEVENGTWIKLTEPTDYKINRYTGTITMNRSTEGLAVAIAYRIEGPNDAATDDIFYGTLTNREKGTDSILVFKLIKPKSLLPQNKQAWQMMMKNIYPLGGRNINKSGFSMDITYRGNTGDPTTKIQGTNILQLFGLDNSTDGVGGPDGRFDYISGVTIDEERGEVIFPSLEPFRDGLNKNLKKYNIIVPPDSFAYGDVYDTTSSAAQNNSIKDRFVITGKTTAGSSNTINLGFNIVENSVQVMLSGQPLVPNVDFTVDYIIGQVIIKNQAALVPGAALSVKFEQNDLFQLASKTLLGLRGDMNLSERTQLGFTAMSLDQQTLSDKVRLGEEPMKNSIYGFDGKTGSELPLLTKAIDALPFISTKEKSDISIFGEAAYMRPDPNTQKSPIPIDNGKSIAYLDDFEGAKRTIPLGVGYGLWHDASAPAYISTVDSSLTSTILDEAKSFMKGRAYWYNVLPSDVGVSTIYGDKKSVATGQDQLTVLNLHYDPRQRGEYNYSLKLVNRFGASASVDSVKRNWAGIQRVLSTSALDLVKENVNFIELWVKVDEGKIDTTRKVYIDLGAISEDVIPNNKLDTEEKGLVNLTLSDGEDNGIDGKNDDEERAEHADFLAANAGAFPELNGDPAGDNWSLNVSAKDYRGANGTEKNAASEIGRLPDTEDLNHNNVLDRTNSYFEYELNLDTSPSNPQCVGAGLNGWYQYRLPLINYKNKIGVPDFSVIEFARIWMTGYQEPVQLRIYDMNLVGNQWEELKKNDSTFVVSTINVEDNPNYVSPPGVIREQDKSVTDKVVYGNEQSLNLKVKDLNPLDSRQAIKRYTYKALDLFNYKEMKMFVHGDPGFKDDRFHATAMLFVRFGRDSMNYYEYRMPVLNSTYPSSLTPTAADAPKVWRPENNIDIVFAELTKIKQSRDTTGGRINTLQRFYIRDSTSYGIMGSPDLSRIAFISVGVDNPNHAGNVTGDIWINELRLADVDNTPGWAYSFSATMKLADLGSIGFTYSKQDPFFHQLETAFGSRTSSVNWSVTAAFSLEKFLPTSWTGTSFPLSFSHSEGLSTPKYIPASDVEIVKAAEAQRDLVIQKGGSAEQGQYEYEKLIYEAQTIRISDSYALPSFKLSMPYDNWFIQDVINKMQFGFSYNTSLDRSPQIAYTKAWNWAANFGYAYTFGPDLFFMPFDVFTDVPVLNGLKDVKLFFPITNFSLKLSSNRSQQRQLVRNQSVENPIQRSFSAARGFSFGWKLIENGILNLSGDYSVDIASTLVNLETTDSASGSKQRSFYSILGSLIGGRYNWLSFGIDNAYTQNMNINTRPRLPDVFGINKYLTLNARYGVGYSWSYNMQLGELGKSTRWSSSLSLGSDLSLKQFVESWWPVPKIGQGSSTTPSQTTTPSGRRRNRDDDNADSAPVNPATPKPSVTSGVDSAATVKDTTNRHTPLSVRLLDITRWLIKTPLLDYDKINISFTETNSSTNTGVPGRPGFANFFGKIPIIQKGDMNYGPTWAYQMGLVSDPTANIDGIQFSSKFPFIIFSTDAVIAKGDSVSKGMRRRAFFLPINSTLPESFTQNNQISFKTNRDLWEGARVDLNWKVGWDYSRTQNIRIDQNHTPSIGNVVTGGSIERTFFTLPFFSSITKSSIGEVKTQFDKLEADTTDHRADGQKLSEAFEKGFETLPFLTKLFGQFMPRLNYAFRWDGLEKYSWFTSWATRVSLDHAYQSSYRRSFQSDPSGIEVTQSQHISSGFAPLLGLSITFKELLKGAMSANIRYSLTDTYDLIPSSMNVAQAGTRELSVTASYGRTGFEIPFFGLALNNDVDISLSYSYAKNSRTTFASSTDPATSLKVLDGTGQPGEGSSRTTMEPRIKYVLSARVTASLFYRYTKVTPDAGGSRIPGSSTNEGGLDVHIAIQ